MDGLGRFLLSTTRWAPAQTPVVIKVRYLGGEKKEGPNDPKST